jgi:hypothetical protein
MSKNLDRLIVILKEQADLIDKLNQRCDFKYKSTQSLVLAYGQPFLKTVKSPFKGKTKACFENCFQALLGYPNFHYCEGFAIDDELPIAVSHAWLINDAGEVVDPTWVGKKHKGSTYFGMALTREFVFEVAQKTKCYGILDSDYMNNHCLMREGFPSNALRQDTLSQKS